MLKISQIVGLCAIVFGLTWSANGLADPSINLNVVLTAPSAVGQAECNAKTTLKLSVGGSVGNLNAGQTIELRLYSMPLQVIQNANACPATLAASGAKQIGPSVPVVFGQPAPSFPLTEAAFNNPTTTDLGFCGNIGTGIWGLCVYAIGSQDLNTPIFTSKPALLTSAEPPVKDSISVSKVVGGDEEITFTVATTGKSYTAFEICYVELTSALSSEEKDKRVSELTSAQKCAGGNLKTKDENGPDIRWKGLANGIEYAFKVGGKAGSLWSEVQRATTRERFTSLESYDGPGGGLSWQCSQSPGTPSPSSLLSFIGIFAAIFFLSPMRRRRIVTSSLSLFAILVFIALPTHASTGQFNLGLTGAPYKPNLDAKTTFPVYKCLYGDAWRPLLGLEFDFHLGDPFGSIQLGFAAAYSWADGKALESLQPGEKDCANAKLSDVGVGLHMLQIRPRLTYIFDPFLDSFALVPYLRAGLVGAGYYFTYQGEPDKYSTSGVNPVGFRFGWEAAFGLMFLLDTLEPTVAAGARATGVYDHTYLKAEIAYMPIDDFGRPGLDFSPKGMFGAPLPLLATFGIVIEFQ